MKDVAHSGGIRVLLPRPNVSIPMIPATAKVVAAHLRDFNSEIVLAASLKTSSIALSKVILPSPFAMSPPCHPLTVIYCVTTPPSMDTCTCSGQCHDADFGIEYNNNQHDLYSSVNLDGNLIHDSNGLP
jgi:hypothetical protein